MIWVITDLMVMMNMTLTCELMDKVMVGRVIIMKGGPHRVWVKPSRNRKGHWRHIEGGLSDDKPVDKPFTFKELIDLSKSELKSSSDEFIKTGKFKLGDNTKLMLDSVKDDKDHTKLLSVNDTFSSIYSNSNKLQNIHKEIKDEWLDTPNGEWTGILKDGIKRKYNNDVVFHGGYNREIVDMNKWDDYIEDSYDEVDVNQEDVDNYIELQKELTDTILDFIYPDTDTISIYRGTDIGEISGDESNDIKIKQNSVSSWTTEKDYADDFADRDGGIVIEMNINKRDVWASFFTHQHDTMDQSEMIVIGDKAATGTIVYRSNK